MAIPDKDTVQAMGFGFEGSPFVAVAGNSVAAADSLGMWYGAEGEVFVAAQPAAGAPPAANPVDRYIMVVVT